jgi:hypothetical protein
MASQSAAFSEISGAMGWIRAIILLPATVERQSGVAFASCGSPLLFKPEASPDAIRIRAAGLDDPSIFKPGMSIYTASAPTCATFSEGVPKFPKMPPIN